MGNEYAKVLCSLNTEFTIVGNSPENVENLAREYKVEGISGGYRQLLENKTFSGDRAINCLPVDTLSESTVDLIEAGFSTILLEKPGAMSIAELEKIQKVAQENSSEVVIGYNRRFYQSTLALEKYLVEDPLTAVNFEITEWSHALADDKSPMEVKQKWIFANTSHVIDLVLFELGSVKQLSTFTAGGIDWHPTGARFVGAGISNNDVLISYMGYWDGPGRWSIDFVTRTRRYIFRPMEKLQIQELGSVQVSFDESIDYTYDEQFKPGLFLQTKSFLDNDFTRLCSLQSQIESFEIYSKIGNYADKAKA